MWFRIIYFLDLNSLCSNVTLVTLFTLGYVGHCLVYSISLGYVGYCLVYSVLCKCWKAAVHFTLRCSALVFLNSEEVLLSLWKLKEMNWAKGWGSPFLVAGAWQQSQGTAGIAWAWTGLPQNCSYLWWLRFSPWVAPTQLTGHNLTNRPITNQRRVLALSNVSDCAASSYLLEKHPKDSVPPPCYL